jgi:hypothetical protein
VIVSATAETVIGVEARVAATAVGRALGADAGGATAAEKADEARRSAAREPAAKTAPATRVFVIARVFLFDDASC